MRINSAIKKGRRRTRRSKKRTHSQDRKDREMEDLASARDYSRGANMSRQQNDDQDDDGGQDDNQGGNDQMESFDDSQFN